MRHFGVILKSESMRHCDPGTETDLNTALIQAITADCTEAVEFLRSISTNEITPLILDTALHSACYSQMTSGVELLLADGADPNL